MKKFAALACVSILVASTGLAVIAQPSVALGKGKGSGGGGSGTGPSFIPEILYTYDKELRLTNEDGSIAKLVFRPRRNTALMRPVLGPRTASGGLIALIANDVGTLFKWSYAANGEVQVQQLAPLPFTGSTIKYMGFSPDGTKIAYNVDFNRIIIADVTNPASPAITKNFPLTGVFGEGIAWLASGNKIVFIGCDGTFPNSPQCGPNGLYTLNPDTGAVSRVTPANATQDHILGDIRPAHTSDGILSSGPTGFPSYEPDDFVYYAAPNFDTPVEYLPTGIQARFSCDDRKIAYRIPYDPNAPFTTLIYDTVNQSSVGFTSDYNVSIEDWMPGCASV